MPLLLRFLEYDQYLAAQCPSCTNSLCPTPQVCKPCSLKVSSSTHERRQNHLTFYSNISRFSSAFLSRFLPPFSPAHLIFTPESPIFTPTFYHLCSNISSSSKFLSPFSPKPPKLPTSFSYTTSTALTYSNAKVLNRRFYFC